MQIVKIAYDILEISKDRLQASVRNLSHGGAAHFIDGASGDFSGETVSAPAESVGPWYFLTRSSGLVAKNSPLL